MNVCFEYQYRDYANYKRYGSFVFENPDALSIAQISFLFERSRQGAFPLAAESQFSAEQLGLPSLRFDGERTSEDHDWHEAVDFSETAKSPTPGNTRSIGRFLYDLALIADGSHSSPKRV